MSKRGATQQLSKEGNFFGDGSNELSGDDKPKKATAAQLANRKLKPLKGRPRVAGSAASSQSFPPASQQQGGSNAFTGFSPAPPSGGFNFSAGPAANPFASQNAGGNNGSSGNTTFSSSFTFGSNNNPPSNPFGSTTPAAPPNNAFGNTTSSSTPSSNSNSSNPFGTIAQSAPATNAFGNTTSSSAPSNNIFGASSPAPTNNLFGGNNNTSSAQSSNLFGSSSSAQPNAFGSNSGPTNNVFAAGSPAPSTNIFSAASSAAASNNVFAPTTSSAPASNLFGASTSANPTNLFGGATSSSPSTNMFASSTSAQASNTSSQSSNNLFTTASSSAPSNNLFGSTSTSAAPSSNLFSSSISTAPSNNLFGNATTSAPSNNMFSGAATSSAPSTNLFGNTTSTTSSAPMSTANTTTSSAPNNIFASSAQQSGSSGPSQTTNLFANSTSDSTPKSGMFNFGAQPAGGTTSTSSEDTPATSGPSQSSTSNLFSKSISGFQPSSSGNNLFGFPTQSPSNTATETAAVADSGAMKGTPTAGDAQTKPLNNLFAQSPSNVTPQIGSNLFGSTAQDSSKPSSSGAPQTDTSLFSFAGRSSTENTDSKAQEDAQKKANSQSSSTANLFAKAASGSTAPPSSLSQPGQTVAPKQDRPAGTTSRTNPFSTIAPSSSSLTSSAAPPFKTNGSSSTQDSASAKTGAAKPAASSTQPATTVSQSSTGSSLDTSKVDPKRIETIRSLRTLNAWFKLRVSEVPEDGSCVRLAEVYLSQFKEITGTPSDGAQTQSKSSGKRKADDDSDANGLNGAGSPKKSKAQSSQDDSIAPSASNTANIFNSIVNKPAQSPLRNVESATSPDAEAGPSSSNIFGASSSSPFKFGATGGISGSTTPVGSPAKPSAFAQSPIKAPVFGQAESSKATDSKRKSADISSDEQDEGSQDDTTQGEKRHRTSPPASSADTGSVLNSRQASPDARNPFGHLSQDESNKDDEDDVSDEEENAELGSTTPKATPARTDGLFSRISKDDTTAESGPKTPEEGSLFGRITGTSTENSKSATANPFGFSAASYEIPGGAKTGPVLKTWNGDAGSPIKFGTSQPAQAENGKKDAPSSSSNPFAGIATSSSSAPTTLFKFTPAATPPASDSSPFKFNPVTATPSGNGSMLGSGLGSRATTPGMSTGASENETSAAENDEDEETETVDKEQIALRTALTEEDKKTYDVLFDTDSQPVVMMRLVNKTEEELKANPGKGTTKFEGQGKGPLRVLKHKESGAVSVLLKSEPMGRVLINTRVLPKFEYKRAKAKLARIPVADTKGTIVQTFLKFEEDDECTKFADVCTKNQPAP